LTEKDCNEALRSESKGMRRLERSRHTRFPSLLGPSSASSDGGLIGLHARCVSALEQLNLFGHVLFFLEARVVSGDATTICGNIGNARPLQKFPPTHLPSSDTKADLPCTSSPCRRYGPFPTCRAMRYAGPVGSNGCNPRKFGAAAPANTRLKARARRRGAASCLPFSRRGCRVSCATANAR
jgi:hypothetical protein